MSVETHMDVSHMKDGDTAGLATYTRSFAYAAVRQENGQRTLGVVKRVYDNGVKDADGNIVDDTIDRDAEEAFVSGGTVTLPDDATNVWIKSDNTLDNASGKLTIQYWYSLDGKQWSKLGDEQGPLTYDWSLSHFKGYRIGLFNYAKENTGGYVDFDYYDLSDVLTSDGKAVDTSKLCSAIDQADSLQSAEYPMDEWDKMLTLLDKAKQALASDPSTQNEVDAPQRALSLQLAQLAVDRQSGDGGNPGGGDQTGDGDQTSDGNQSGNGDQTGDGGQQQSSTADDNSSELSSTGSSVTPMVLSAIALMLAGISVIRIRRSSR